MLGKKSGLNAVCVQACVGVDCVRVCVCAADVCGHLDGCMGVHACVFMLHYVCMCVGMDVCGGCASFNEYFLAFSFSVNTRYWYHVTEHTYTSPSIWYLAWDGNKVVTLWTRANTWSKLYGKCFGVDGTICVLQWQTVQFCRWAKRSNTQSQGWHATRRLMHFASHYEGLHLLNHCPTWWCYSILKCTLLYEAAATCLTVEQPTFLLQIHLNSPCESPK